MDIIAESLNHYLDVFQKWEDEGREIKYFENIRNMIFGIQGGKDRIILRKSVMSAFRGLDGFPMLEGEYTGKVRLLMDHWNAEFQINNYNNGFKHID